MVEDELESPSEPRCPHSKKKSNVCTKEKCPLPACSSKTDSSDDAVKLAHDINNMLLVIQNTLELAWGHSDHHEDSQAVKTIKMAVEQASHLAGQIMESRSNISEISVKAILSAEFIASHKSLLCAVAAHNVTVHVTAAENLPAIEVNEGQLCDVLMNLVKNASEAYGDKHGSVQLSVHPETMNSRLEKVFSRGGCQPKHGKGIVFTVKDHGPGVEMARIDSLLSGTYSTKVSGHGIGLVNVMDFVKSSKGGVAIESTLGAGFTIRLWIPERERQTTPNHRKSKQKNTPYRERVDLKTDRKPCILMLDDDLAILQSSALLLGSMNTDVLTVSNSEDAFKIFSANKDKIDIVFLDANVGDSTTLPVLESLKNLDPLMPCIIVSGYAESKIRSLFNPDLYNGFLGKPYTRSDITKILYQQIRIR